MVPEDGGEAKERGRGMTATTLYVLLVIFLATLLRSALGFGEALFAVPLLALCLPLQVAAPLAVLVSITIAAVIVAQDWREIHLRSTVSLTISTLFGIPAGLWLLTSSHQRAVKLVLAFLILAFAGYSLAVTKPPELKTDSRVWLAACGFLAGVMGGAYGMNGPPLAVYGGMRRWSPKNFRATLQGYFLPASLAGMAGYWLAGLWTANVSRYFLLSLPAMLPAIFLGRAINRRLHGDAFLKWAYLVLLGVGAVLLAQAAKP